MNTLYKILKIIFIVVVVTIIIFEALLEMYALIFGTTLLLGLFSG